MKRLIVTFVLIALLAATAVMAPAWGSKHAAPSAGWTWDGAVLADGAWGS